MSIYELYYKTQPVPNIKLLVIKICVYILTTNNIRYITILFVGYDAVYVFIIFDLHEPYYNTSFYVV